MSETITRWTLTAPGHVKFVLTLTGKKLVTNDEIAQTFPSNAAAREHVERVLKIRKKEGYAIAIEELDAAALAKEAEAKVAQGADSPITDDATLKIHEGKWLATFRGDKTAPLATCQKVVERIEKDRPKSVQLVCDLAVPDKNWVAALKGKKLDSIEAFIFDTYFQTQTRQATNTIGDLAATIGACPSLLRMFATGSLSITKCTHPKLETLHLLGDPLSPPLLEGLGSCEFPKLERLVLGLASDAGPGPDDAAIAALTKLKAPKLTEVIIESLEDVAGTIARLAPIAKKRGWTLLALGGMLEDEDMLMETLKKHANELEDLDVLALPFGDDLSVEAEENAQAIVEAAIDIDEYRDVTLPAAYSDW